MSRDAIAGLVIFVTSLALFGLTLDLKDSPLVPVGPADHDRAVGNQHLAVVAVIERKVAADVQRVGWIELQYLDARCL